MMLKWRTHLRYSEGPKQTENKVRRVSNRCSHDDVANHANAIIQMEVTPTTSPSFPRPSSFPPILTSKYLPKSTPTIKKSSDGLVVLRRLCNQLSCKHKHLTDAALRPSAVLGPPRSKEIVGSNPTRCNSLLFLLLHEL